MIGPRYEVWTYITVNGQRVTEPRRCKGAFLSRFWTHRGAVRWGASIVHNPRVLVSTLDTLYKKGVMMVAEYEVRRV